MKNTGLRNPATTTKVKRPASILDKLKSPLKKK